MNNIYNLFLKIKNYNYFWEGNIININREIKKKLPVNIKDKKNILSNLESSSFICKKILKHVVNNFKNIYNIKLHYFNQEIVIYTFIPHNELLLSIYYILFILYLNKDNKNNRNNILKIHLFPIDNVKYLPKKYENIDSKHINSAFTIIYYNMIAGPIYIWRYDELNKVLIHELLHSFHYDISLLDYKNSYFYNIKNLNECFTEYMATLYFISLKLFLINNNAKFNYKIFKKILFNIINKENKYNNELIKIILNYNNFKKINNFLSSEYIENTSLFCYIVLKSSLLNNFIRNGNIFFEINNSNLNNVIQKTILSFNNKIWKNKIENNKKKIKYCKRLKFCYYS